VINVGETKCQAQTKEKINKANEDKKNTYLKLESSSPLCTSPRHINAKQGKMIIGYIQPSN
jgi:hypothetical protein